MSNEPENFSWYEHSREFRSYVLALPDANVSEILGAIPSAWNIPPKSHSEFVRWLLGRVDPTTTVELGVDYGYSSFLMSLCSKGLVYGIDCFETEKHADRQSDDHQFVLDVQKKLGLDNLKVIKGYFDDVASTWDKKIDILHIDGLHDYESCKHDYETWTPFLSQGGVVIMHDTISRPEGVGVFFSEIKTPKLNFQNSCGLGVVSENVDLLKEIAEIFASTLALVGAV